MVKRLRALADIGSSSQVTVFAVVSTIGAAAPRLLLPLARPPRIRGLTLLPSYTMPAGSWTVKPRSAGSAAVLSVFRTTTWYLTRFLGAIVRFGVMLEVSRAEMSVHVA